MSKKSIIMLVCAIILLIGSIIFVVWVNSGNEQEEKREVLNEVSNTRDITDARYSDFTVYREDKSEVKLSDFEPKATMLLFFNESSEESMQVLQKVEDMYKDYEEKINFIMINTSREVNKDLQKNYSLEIYYDFYEEAARNYNVKNMPSMIYINDAQEIFNAKEGFTTSDALEANLDILSNNY